MRPSLPILIGCPQHGRFVRGWYDCDESGRPRLGADGSYLLACARCDHDRGRCMQTLCGLHRFNRRGPRTWLPSEIRAVAPAARQA
jgi:hypothetical protein